jgi:LacI family transcriptional regulator
MTDSRMKITIVDIAEKSQVSPTTVSRALKDDPRITDEVKERVKQIARDLGYRPNLLARGLVNNKTHSIGYVVDNLSWSYFSDLAECVQTAAEQHHYSSYIHSSLKQPNNERQGIEGLLSRGVDGFLISPTEAAENLPIFRDLVQREFPVVFLSEFPGLNAAKVTVDNYAGARAVMRHLFELGHRRIAYVGPREESTVKSGRVEGYRTSLEEQGIKTNDELLFCEEDDALYGYRVVPTAMRSRRPPTAIFAHNDTLASGVYRGLYELGLTVPRNVSVVGFDDLPMCELMFPPLTSVGVPLFELAETAVSLLLSLIANERPSRAARQRRIDLTPRLVVRASTARRPRMRAHRGN